MDSFDKRFLAVLKDGKPRGFQQLSREAGFSHNTLRLHVTSLKRQGFIVETRNYKESPGRPGLTHFLPLGMKNRVALTLTDPYTVIVSLTFQKLRHLCRFGKGGYCKNMRTKCEAQDCPQVTKGQ
jgi:DNA-binding Lrp family transcriptional regulator